MTKKLLFILGLITLFGISAKAQDISGEWRMISNDGQQIFTLNLIHITKDRLRGVHCIENFEIEIIECFKLEQVHTINLVKIAKNIFKGNMMIGRGRNKTLQNIQLQYRPLNNTILFTLTRIPEGEFIVPLEAVLQRK